MKNRGLSGFEYVDPGFFLSINVECMARSTMGIQMEYYLPAVRQFKGHLKSQ